MSEQSHERPAAARPGRPVGPLGRTRRVEVRIPGPVLELLDAEAARRGTSRSRALVDAILALLASQREVGSPS